MSARLLWLNYCDVRRRRSAAVESDCASSLSSGYPKPIPSSQPLLLPLLADCSRLVSGRRAANWPAAHSLTSAPSISFLNFGSTSDADESLLLGCRGALAKSPGRSTHSLHKSDIKWRLTFLELLDLRLL